MQIPGQVPTSGQVPDESVVPQWSNTFSVILKAREDRFLSFRTASKEPNPPKPQIRTLSDEELINGKGSQPPPEIPRLQGAEACDIRELTDPILNGAAAYECFFLPHGKSAADMQQAFVSVVRLVEKATGGSATQGSKPYISGTMESRLVHIGKIAVEERWLPEDRENALERLSRPLVSRSRVWVEVLSDPPPKPVVTGSTADLPIQRTFAPVGLSGLTPCEENGLFSRGIEAETACKKEDEASFAKDEAFYAKYPNSPKPQFRPIKSFWSTNETERARKAFLESCTKSTRGCASLLYTLGDYDTALAEASPQIDALKQQFESNQEYHKKTGGYQSAYVGVPDRLGAGSVADAYALRSVIKYSLSDTDGALADLRSAIDYIGAWRQEGDFGRASLDQRVHLYKAYLYRSAISYGLGRYGEAIADFNEYAALGKFTKYISRDAVTDEKLHKLILQALNGTASQAPTQPEPNPLSKNSIKTQIDEVIKSERYTALPTPTINRSANVPNGSALVNIKNDTAYKLTVLLSGPLDRQIEIDPRTSTSINMVSGTYKVVGRVAAANVLPSYGEYSLSGGNDLSFHLQ